MASFTALLLAAVFTYAHCGCPDGWSQYMDSCYWDSTETANSWSDAETRCNKRGAFLTEITSQEENDFIARMTFGGGHWFWMGVTHKESCDGYVTESSGKKISYAYWNENEQNKSDKPDCVLMGYLGLWETNACDDKQYFICESNDYISSSGFGGWLSNTNSFSYNNHYYRTVGKLATFNEAKELCEDNDAYLVEPDTEEENKYVHDKMHEAFYGKWRYIGANDKKNEGDFVWSDSGNAVSFENWWPGEPNNKGYSGEDCMEMRYWGKWNDVDCYDNNQFICEINLNKKEPEKEDCEDDKKEDESESTTQEPTTRSRQETTTVPDDSTPNYYY